MPTESELFTTEMIEMGKGLQRPNGSIVGGSWDLSVGLISTSYIHDKNEDPIILDGIKDSPISFTDTVQVVESAAFQLLATWRSRILC
jgi:hypothetical protein